MLLQSKIIHGIKGLSHEIRILKQGRIRQILHLHLLRVGNVASTHDLRIGVGAPDGIGEASVRRSIGNRWGRITRPDHLRREATRITEGVSGPECGLFGDSAGTAAIILRDLGGHEIHLVFISNRTLFNIGLAFNQAVLLTEQVEKGPLHHPLYVGHRIPLVDLGHHG